MDHRERVPSALIATLAPAPASVRFGVLCGRWAAAVGVATLAVLGWAGVAYASGDIDAVWLPLAIAPPFLSTTLILVRAWLHTRAAARA